MAQQKQLRVLIVTGGHGFDRKEFFSMFDGHPDITYEEVQQPKANELWGTAAVKRYDAIVFYDMWQRITDKQRENFVRMLKDDGKGIVVLHHAIASYQDWDEYTRIIGAKYFLAPGKDPDGNLRPRCQYKHDVRMTVHIADGKHPITRGMSDFEIIDETYKGYWVSPKVHVLLTVDHPLSEEKIAWAHTYGKARVVYIQLGHGPTAYRNANYRKLVIRAIRWVAGQLQ